MPPKITFICRKEKKDVPLTDYKYARMSNGGVIAHAPCPDCGSNMTQFASKGLFTPAELAKLPAFKSKGTKSPKKTKTPKKGKTGSASRGSRKSRTGRRTGGRTRR